MNTAGQLGALAQSCRGAIAALDGIVECEIRCGKLLQAALEGLKYRLLDVLRQQLGHARGQSFGRAECGNCYEVADSREILADAFCFPDDLTGHAPAGLRTATRVGTEAVNLLFQPLEDRKSTRLNSSHITIS